MQSNLVFMNRIYTFLIVFWLAAPLSVFAQKNKASGLIYENKVTEYIDSLALLRQRLDSLSRVNDSLRHESNDGRFFRLFAPLTFYHSPAGKTLMLNSPLIGKDSVADAIDAAMMNVYLHRPELVLNSESNLRKVGSIRDDFDHEVKPQVTLTDKKAPLPVAADVLPSGELFIQKPNFWTFKGDNYLQLLQNYVSGNWYKGGESNYSMVGSVSLEANYNNKQKIKWDNKLELKLGFQTSRDDTIHKIKSNNDLIRYTGKFGVQAHKRWYYSLQLLAYTQFTKGLKSNDEYVYSDFMSPFNLNVGLGMEYAVEAFSKRLTGTINFSALSYNFRYVDRKYLNKRYGIRGDHHTMEDIGSQITADLTWNIHDNIKWKARIFAYTSYHRVEVEMENTISFNFNRYISTNLFLYPRFDDCGERDSYIGYWQFKEYLSLGFNYSF